MPLPRLGGTDEPQRKVPQHRPAPLVATLRSWTVVHVPPAGVEAPHTVALVEAPDGRRLLAVVPPALAQVQGDGRSHALSEGLRVRIGADEVGTWHVEAIL